MPFGGATNTEALVKDPIISRFNVAEEITLDDFTAQESKKLTFECEFECTSGQRNIEAHLSLILTDSVADYQMTLRWRRFA